MTLVIGALILLCVTYGALTILAPTIHHAWCLWQSLTWWQRIALCIFVGGLTIYGSSKGPVIAPEKPPARIRIVYDRESEKYYLTPATHLEVQP